MYRLRGLGTTPLAMAIFRQEGSVDSHGNWVPTSLGVRLNNPGNLNYAGQPGCHATTLGNGLEAQCDSMDAGIAATDRQLALDASRGLTLAERLSTWATGNQGAYVSNVSNWLGVDPDTPLSSLLGGSAAIPSSDGAVPSDFSLDTSSLSDLWGSGDDSGSGLSTGALVALGIAGIAVAWAVAG